MHPRWLFGTALPTLLREGLPRYQNADATRITSIFSANTARTHVRDSLSWRDLEWMRARWKGKLVIKGVLAVADVRMAREIGVDGILVSNHGGRQLDGSVAPLHVLPGIAAEAGDMAVLYDGGIRRGTDVIKALALGADFVFVGRPCLYAAAIAEETGVRHAIRLLQQEIDRDLALLGCADLSDLAARVVRVTGLLQLAAAPALLD